MPSQSSNLAAESPSEDIPNEALSVHADSKWVSRQVQAMATAWSLGERVTAAELLAGHPELGDEAAIRLIYEETCLRRESGQDVDTSEVVSRFPCWKHELEVLLGCDRMLRPFSRIAALPEVGEDLGPFRLLLELGRGASGKTYLAAEPALAGRLVVLKVISDDQEEHLSLARLQHTHIIPLFSEHTFPRPGTEGTLHALPRGHELSPDSGGSLRDPACPASRPPSPRGPRSSPGEPSSPFRLGRPLSTLPRAGVVRPSHLLDRGVFGRGITRCACAWPGSHGREALECPDCGRRTADAPRLPPGPATDAAR